MISQALAHHRQLDTPAPLLGAAPKQRPPASVGLPLFMQTKPAASEAGARLQRQCTCTSTPRENDECDTCHSAERLQAQLTIGAIDDPLEREADRVAEQVLTAPAAYAVSSATPHIQRYTEPSAAEKSTLPASVDRVLASAGEPLESTLQHDMASRFGHDFSQVRVHADSAAEQSARDVNARAYTVGHQLVFGAGQFAPHSREGQRLLAHELTHVVQQSGLRGEGSGPGGLSADPASPRDNLPAPSLMQRAVLENDPSTAPPMACATPTSNIADYHLQISFAASGAQIGATDKLTLAGFATEWNLSPVQPTVRVDGFASIDGGASINWPLSCARAEAVATELNAPSVGGKPGIPSSSLEYFANGETNRFSTSLAPNRVAGIYAPGMTLPSSREPSVFDWSTNNTGSTEGANCCAVCPVNLGVDCDSPNFKNGIELVASIRDHDPAYAYDVKRTKEAKYHRSQNLPLGIRGPWQTVSSMNKPAGTSDDARNTDECLIPQPDGSVHKVYSEDRPGFRSTLSTATYDAYVQMINFVEFVRIHRADGTTYDDPLQQNWHTKLLVVKQGGNWQVDTTNSEIDSGHLSSLDP